MKIQLHIIHPNNGGHVRLFDLGDERDRGHFFGLLAVADSRARVFIRPPDGV